MIDAEFTATLWVWKGGSWHFVRLPEVLSVEIADQDAALGPRPGFGSVRVEAEVGSSRWRTSLFPDKASGCYVLPVKKPVREAEGLLVDDEITLRLRVLE